MDSNTNPNLHAEVKETKTSMNKGIIFVIFVIGVVLLAAGAYYLGSKNSKIIIAVTPTPASVPQATVNPQVVVSVSPTVSPSNVPAIKVNAGANIGVFHPYTIKISDGWQLNQVKDPYLNELDITKGDYKLVIKQAGGGGANCVYDKADQGQFSSYYAYYKDLGGVHSFRRSGDSENGKNFVICEPKQQGFGFPTFFGYIDYTVPLNSDKATLTEMDWMLDSLQNNP